VLRRRRRQIRQRSYEGQEQIPHQVIDNPRVMSQAVLYDVASNICQALVHQRQANNACHIIKTHLEPSLLESNDIL
jgi:hypothetical protein